MWGKAQQSADWYIYPAVFALSLSILDVIYFVLVFKESLPAARRNQSTSATFQQALEYINPVKLFRFASLTNLPRPSTPSSSRSGPRTSSTCSSTRGWSSPSPSSLTSDSTSHQCNRFSFSKLDYEQKFLFQGRMFLFVGIVMAVLQGGVVRRLPQGSERKAAMG